MSNKEQSINLEQHKEDGLETMTSTQVLSPVLGTPNKALWIRCNPKFQMELTVAKGSVGASGVVRTYLVNGINETIHQRLKENLDNCYRANVALFCSTNKFWGCWPYKRTSAGDIPHIAHTSAESCFQEACSGFVKIRYKDHAEGYVTTKPQTPELFVSKEPAWPAEEEWEAILNRAFKGHIIQDEDHYVYQSAIGGHVG